MGVDERKAELRAAILAARAALSPVAWAEEDAAEVRTEYETLGAERADLEAAIAKLRQGISTLNREGRGRLLDAFEQVNANFSQLFTRLFNGGEARLVLVESDDPLEAAKALLEIENRLSELSGQKLHGGIEA